MSNLSMHWQAALLTALVALATPAVGQVRIDVGPSRPTVLYSSETRQDCSEYFMLQDDELPFNVVRLHAVLDPPVEGATFQWSLPSPNDGFLLADDDLGPTEQAAAIRGFCAGFGNACILTKDGLRFYEKDTVLWAAPTCSILPANTRRPFDGRTVRIKVKARDGGRRLGKASASIRYGDPSAGSVTAWVIINDVADDGTGQRAVPGGFEITPVNATVSPEGLPGLPAIDTFVFTGSTTARAPTCPLVPEEPCAYAEADSPGQKLLKVKVELADGSALCDNVNYRVGTCIGRPKLTIPLDPKKRIYTTGDEVRLRAHVQNDSPRGDGCALLLRGADVLICDSTFKIGNTKEVVTTSWDLQHCSQTSARSCTTDAECSQDACGECQAGETCLTHSHCSESLGQACNGDADCEPPICSTCRDAERCIRVLETPTIIVPVGEGIDLVDAVIPLSNEIRGKIRVKEDWTLNTSAQGSDDASITYGIRGLR